jgi:hypothetical protein
MIKDRKPDMKFWKGVALGLFVSGVTWSYAALDFIEACKLL